VHLLFLNTREKTEINEDKKRELENYIQQHLTEIPSSIYYSHDEDIINGILKFAQI
jgi:hypothetical protein